MWGDVYLVGRGEELAVVLDGEVGGPGESLEVDEGWANL